MARCTRVRTHDCHVPPRRTIARRRRRNTSSIQTKLVDAAAESPPGWTRGAKWTGCCAPARMERAQRACRLRRVSIHSSHLQSHSHSRTDRYIQTLTYGMDPAGPVVHGVHACRTRAARLRPCACSRLHKAVVLVVFLSGVPPPTASATWRRRKKSKFENGWF